MATTTTGRSRRPVQEKPSKKLDERVFGVVPTDFTLLKEAYITYLANGRDNLAATKTRAEVRGGGKKPWRQKGTGRARIGSIRAPHWRGGGVVHGPTGTEHFGKHLNVKAKRQALRQALSLAAQDGRVKIIDKFDAAEGKVAKTRAQFAKAGAEGRILLVLAQKDNLVERATRNLQEVEVVRANYLNVFDIINADVVLFDGPALEIVTAWLGGDQASSPRKKEAK